MRPLHMLLMGCLIATGIHCSKDKENASDVQSRLQGDWQLIAEYAVLQPPGTPLDTPRILHFAGNVETIYKKDTVLTDTFHIAYTTDQATKKRVPCYMSKQDIAPYQALGFKGDTLTFYTVNVQDGGESVYVRVTDATIRPGLGN